MRSKFYRSIEKHQNAFDIKLKDETIGRLENFYRGVMNHNDVLHLVGKCSAEEFAIRHILESLFALRYLPENSMFADIGSGAGLPGIPCMIVRPDLKGILIESKQKKAGFLRTAVIECSIKDRATVVNQQFDKVPDQDASHIFCRAIDGFSKKLPRIINWSKTASMILFAGNNVRDALKKTKAGFDERLIPMSERRFIFHIKRDGNGTGSDTNNQ